MKLLALKALFLILTGPAILGLIAVIVTETPVSVPQGVFVAFLLMLWIGCLKLAFSKVEVLDESDNRW